MGDDEKTARVIVVAIVVAIVICVGGFTSCAYQSTISDNPAISQMVKDGVDPMVASCAVKPRNTRDCNQLVLQPQIILQRQQ